MYIDISLSFYIYIYTRTHILCHTSEGAAIKPKRSRNLSKLGGEEAYLSI